MPVAPRKVFDLFVGLLEDEGRSFGCMVGRSFFDSFLLLASVYFSVGVLRCGCVLRRV